MKRKVLAAIRSVLLVPPFFVFTIILSGLVLIVNRKKTNIPATDRILDVWSGVFLGIPRDFPGFSRDSPGFCA